MIARLKCWIFGHRRGKRVDWDVEETPIQGYQRFQCPRCKDCWTRKVKA